MKKLLSSFVILLAAFAAVAQNSFSYQSVIRADGKVLENKSISLRLSIMLDDSICYQEQHAVTTNAYGNVNVSVGEGEPLKGSFAAVPWESMRVMMRIEADVAGGADFTDLGSMQIMPVPYAMYAHRTTKVIQPAEASEEPIFEINDSNGNPMFAVYETGVKVFVDYDDDSKAAKSKFAVAGRPGKGDDIDLLTIDKDGTLVYVDDNDDNNENTNTNANKAAKSKFAVAGRPGRKGEQQNNLLTIDGSGSTIYIDDNNNKNTNTNANKAAKSKFAVAGRPGRKSATDTYFTIDQNGTLVYVGDNYDNDANTNANANKAAKSRFAVAGRPGRKGSQQNNMLTIDCSGSTIYIDDNKNTNANANKAAKSRFAVAGRPGRKGADSKSENLFTIDGDGSTIYVDFNSSDKAAKSRFAVAGRPGRKDASDNVMTIDGDQATFYIDVDDNDNQNGKAAKSRFAVAGRPGKGDVEPYFIIDQFGSVIYIDEADSKAAKSRFAVAGRSGKGSDNYFTINRDSTRIYINDAPVADTTTGEVVVPSLASGFAVVGMVQKSDLLAVSKDSTIIKIDTYVAEEVQSVSGEVSKIIDDSKADKSYSSGALYLPLVKSEGGMTTTKKFLINYTYYHSDNGEYLYLKTQFKSGSDLINTFRNYYIVDGQVYGDNTYHVKYIEAGAPTIMPYSEVNSDFKEKLKLNLKSDNDLLVILESTMRDSAYSALAEDGRTAFYSPNGDHGKVMESERNIVAMMNDSARSLFTGNLNVFYSLLDTAVRATQTVGMSYLTSLQWNYGTVSDFYNVDLSDYYYTLYDGDVTDENIKITENSEDFAMRGDYQRRNLTEIETMFAGLKDGFDINAQPNNAAWGSVVKPASKVNYGDSINLVPVAAEGCIFLGWNDGCADSVRRIGITGPINYTAKFQPSTYYVSNKNSSGDFDGLSALTPLDSLSKAIEKINAIGKADASFTINISGLFVNDTTVTIGACAAKSLTIAGTDKQADGFKINADDNVDAKNKNVLCVANSTTKVTLKNLKITGGRQYGGYASPLYVGGENINANVVLDNVLITENGVNGNTEAICCAGILVVEGSTLTIGQGTVIENNYLSGNGAAIVNSGTTVMKGGFIGNNIGDEYAPMDIYNYGEFTIDGDVEVGNVVVYYEYSSNTFKTITIGNNFNATADIVGTFGGLYGYYSNETKVLTLPDGLSDDQKKAICDKFAVEPETDWNDNPISYWKVGISGKLEQVGHVVFVAEQEITTPWGIDYKHVTLLEYNLDFGSKITEKPADPEGDYMYIWYKMNENGQPDVNEFDFTKTITSDEPIIGLLGRVVPTKCYVSFDTKVEDVELATQEVAYGAKLTEQWQQTLQTLPSNPDFKKDGYTFAGWCVENDLWYKQYRIAHRLVPFDFEQPITANVTLIANWVANELYVDVNNGSDNYSGIASNKALKTIQKAIDTIKYWNVDTLDYTIKVSGSSDEKVRIGDEEQYPYAIAKTITLQGVGANSGLTNNSKNYYTMLKVGPNNEVVLNNFKFNPVSRISDKMGKAIYVCVNAKVTLSEGTVLDGTNAGDYLTTSNNFGGGVYVEGGTLVMESDAVIKNFKMYHGGGVYVTYKESYLEDDSGTSTTEYKQGTFIMKGNSAIENCQAGYFGGGVYVDTESKFEMKDYACIGGEGKGCSANGMQYGGGGVYLRGGNATIDGNATISYNSSNGDGGGVYVNGGSKLTMKSGAITNNNAGIGCGVYVNVDNSAASITTGEFDMQGGLIINNGSGDNLRGKGVYVDYFNGYYATFKMSGSAKVDANNDVCLKMNNDNDYVSAKITVAGELQGNDTVAVIIPFLSQNNQHQSGLQVLATADGAQMQNDKFVVTDQVVGTTTTWWKVDGEGKLALRSVVAFMNNGTVFAKMPVGNNGKVAEPATKPTSTDKVFTGWYTDAEGTIPFNFDNEVGSTTTTLYAGWGDPEVYVPSAPSSVTGAFIATSLAKAVELINSKDAPDLDWTIKINDQLTGKQVISGEIAADSIILIGAHGLANGVPRDMLNGNFTEPTDSAVLNIFATNPVIIKNLKITGGNNSTDLWTGTVICGGGIHVAADANVSLADGVMIAGNKAYAGGGAYVKGIMYMYGSAVIGDANATKAPVGESDCANYASQYGGGVYVAGGSFYMGSNSCTMSVVNQQAVYEYNNVKLTGGVFGNRSNYDGGGVYSSGSYAKVYMNSGVIANNSALKNGGAVRNTTVSGFILSGDAYIPAGADFKHDVYLENGYANVTIDGTLTHEKVAQIMPTKTRTTNSISYDNKYSDYGSLDDKNNQYGKFAITPFVISETVPNTITYYQYTYVNGQGIKATANGSAQNIPQFNQITLSDNVFGGDDVTATITGANFTEAMLNFTSICLNDTMVNATFNYVSSTEITATFPAPATAGTRTVKVQTYGAEPLSGTLVVNGADPHTFYVKPQSEGGDDDNSGLKPDEAFASLSQAIDMINGDTETEYTIKVIGKVPSGNLTLEGTQLDGKAGRITFEGATGLDGNNIPQDSITGSGQNPVLNIQTTVPITIKNLKIRGGAEGGIHMSSEGNPVDCDVTLAVGALITGNHQGNFNGEAIQICSGTLTMLAGSKVSGNSNNGYDGQSAIAVYGQGTLDMQGGEISNNGGNAIAANGTLKIGGAVNISERINLDSEKQINITKALEISAPIAVRYQYEPDLDNKMVVYDGSVSSDWFTVTQYNNSGEDTYYVVDADGYLNKCYKVDFVYYNGSTPVVVERRLLATNETIGVAPNTPSSHSGSFDGWFVIDEDDNIGLEFSAEIEVEESDLVIVGVWSNTIEVKEGGAVGSLDAACGQMDSYCDYTLIVDGTLNGAQTIRPEVKPRLITLRGKTGTNATIDGGWKEGGNTPETTYSALTISGVTQVHIRNITIKGGYAEMGGGIMVNNSNVTIVDGTNITANFADYGGGVCVQATGTIYMSDDNGNIISNNTARYYGGGIYAWNYSYFYLYGGQISGNKGGGIYVSDDYALATEHLLAGVSVSGNTASGNGGYYGGVYCTARCGISMQGGTTVDTIYLRPNAQPITIADELTAEIAAVIKLAEYSTETPVLYGEEEIIATEYGKFTVVPQPNSTNPDKPIQWEINAEGYLQKVLPVKVVLTNSTIQDFYPDEGKSYEFIFDNTVTNSDLQTFCTNCGNLKRSSTLDMSQATSITNVDRLPAYLISVVLPPNVESISSDAFTDIAFRGEATSVTIADGNAHYKTIDGVLFGEIERWGAGISNLLFYPPAKSGSTYEIPSFVIRIEDCGFMYNKNLETISGLARIEYLQTFVFVECQKLKSANLSGATMVGYNLFRNCPALESVTWGAADMLWAVFADCPKLEQIHFTSATPPSYLGEYGDYPVEFYGCNPNLKFYVPAGSRNAYLNATGDNGFYSSANACYDGNTYGYGGSLADRIIEESTGYIGSKAPGSQLAIGDIVFNDGSATAYVEGLTLDENQKAAAVAVIFYTDGGSLGTKTLGVGLVQSSGKWGDDSNISDINDENNGANNLSWVKSYCYGDLNNNIHFPLFSWADKYGSTNSLTGNWYPPAINELSAIWQNKTLINNAMGALGKTALSGNYWSSTYNGEGMAKYVDMSSGVSGDYMTTTYNFVAIRVFE